MEAVEVRELNIVGSENENRDALAGKDTIRFITKEGGKFCYIRDIPEKNPNYKNWQKKHYSGKAIYEMFKKGFPVGLLGGEPSDGLCLLDLDLLYSGFIAEYPQFVAPTIIGSRTKDAGKVLVRTPDGILPNRKRSLPSEERFLEWLSTGNQGVVAGKHPSGVDYILINSDLPIVEITCAEVEDILRSWCKKNGVDYDKGGSNGVVSELTFKKSSRNVDLTSLAGMLVAKKVIGNDLNGVLQAVNNNSVSPSLDPREVERIAISVSRYATEKVTYRRTDLGNAERFADQCSDTARYCNGLGRGKEDSGAWLIWNGKVWARDETNKVYELAAEVAKNILIEARFEENSERREKLQKWSSASQSRTRMDSMLAQGRKAIGRLKINVDELDSDIWLLNCPNGIVDLRTGEVHEHSPEGFLTKITRGSYIPGKTHPLWEKVLDDWTGGDAEMKAFLKRMTGYTLIGRNIDEKFFLILGPTRSGKSTCTNDAVAHTLGDYAVTVDAKTFLKSEGDRWTTGHTPRPDIIRLIGARMVVVPEGEKGAQLATSFVKNATGNDKLAVRGLYAGLIEFTPAFKAWFFANDEDVPLMDARSDATWERVVKVPFSHFIPPEERDPNIKLKLQNDPDVRDAILTWAVEGCLEYLQIGLALPDMVKKATQELRKDMDVLDKFYREELQEAKGEFLRSNAIQTRLSEWCDTNSVEKKLRPSASELKSFLEERGHVSKRRSMGNIYTDLAFRDDEDWEDSDD